MSQDTLEQIINYHQKVQEHHQSAIYRIWAYYHEPQVTELEEPPHDKQFKQAAAYIDMALTKIGRPGNKCKGREVSTEWISRRDWSRHMAADLLYGVALELIVSTIHLKLDTRNYLSHMTENNGNTPHIEESKEHLLDDLCQDISNDHVKEIEATLDLVKLKRNNLAHFGYHYHGGPDYSRLFVTVAGYLINRYMDGTNISELDKMAEYLDRLDQQTASSEIYPELSVDFRSES